MLTARWHIRTREAIKGFDALALQPKWPDLVVEIRCCRCGDRLGNGGVPYGEHKTEFRTALLRRGLVYDRKADRWEPSRRVAWQLKQARGTNLHYQTYSALSERPRRRLRLGDAVYLPREELGDGDYPPGVAIAGKLIQAGYPQWEVPLPVDVRCPRCRWVNSIEPFSADPMRRWTVDHDAE